MVKFGLVQQEACRAIGSNLLTHYVFEKTFDNLHIDGTSHITHRGTHEDAMMCWHMKNGDTLVGVFDGHGGHRVSEACRLHFGNFFENALELNPRALETVFSEFDLFLRNPEGQAILAEIPPSKLVPYPRSRKSSEETDAALWGTAQGSTAIVALIQQNGIIKIAAIGDSGYARITSSRDIEMPSFEHQCSNKAEEARIVRSGHHVSRNRDMPRLDGVMSISRGLANFIYKDTEELPQSQQAMSTVPWMTEIHFSEG